MTCDSRFLKLRGVMIKIVENNGVALLQSNLLLSSHGFSTRVGGVSRTEHTASLNLAYGRGDDDATVMENLKIFCSQISVEPEDVISVPQIHSADVKVVGEKEKGIGVSKSAPFSCDGYVTGEKGVPIGIKTADCVPILLEARDEENNVIAVSAIHAGWRGTVDGIARVAIEKLVSLGADPEKIYVAIGPCIHSCCYEVGEDFVKAVKEKLGQNYDENYIISRSSNKKYADITKINLDILLQCGVPRGNIDVCELCTCCHTELFYSHRASRGKRGTMMSVIQK